MVVLRIENDKHFAELINSSGTTIVLVYFSAQWCGPCQTIGPVFEQLSDLHPKCIFAKADVNLLEESAVEEHRVQSLPTFIAFKEGNKLGRLASPEEAALREFVDKFS